MIILCAEKMWPIFNGEREEFVIWKWMDFSAFDLW